MKNSDKAISLIVLGPLAPLVLMLLLWWGSVPFLRDNGVIMILALAGLAAGIALDIFVLRKFIFGLFRLPVGAIVAVEIFYSIMIYGFFMGLPVFNSLMGIAAGYIIARSGVINKAPKEAVQKKANVVNLISALLLFSLCIASAVLALNESTITSQLKNMLGLSFEVTMQMVWLIIVLGGIALLLFQYFFSRLAVRRVLKRQYA